MNAVSRGPISQRSIFLETDVVRPSRTIQESEARIRDQSTADEMNTASDQARIVEGMIRVRVVL
jgi:hypothetical protein